MLKRRMGNHTAATAGLLGSLVVLSWPGLAQVERVGQPSNPVLWQLTNPARAAARQANLLTLVAHADIRPGWHLYALQEPEGGPAETAFFLTPAGQDRLLYVEQSPPVSLPDPVSGEATFFFQHQASFTLHLQIAPGTGASSRPPEELLVRYQVCDAHLCLPPRTDRLRLPAR